MKEAVLKIFFKKILLIVCGCLWMFLLSAQESALYWMKKLGNDLYESGNYGQALTTYDKYYQQNLTDYEVLLRIAICSYHTNHLAEAKTYLQHIILHAGYSFPEIYLYQGKIAQAEDQFRDAATFYKQYLKLANPSGEQRRLVKKDILHCATGMRTTQHKELGYVEGLGKTVNTEWDEFGSVHSPNYENRIYFSTNRRDTIARDAVSVAALDSLDTNIYFTQTFDGKWFPARPLEALLNTNEFEHIIDINADGSVLYYARGKDNLRSTIYTDTFQQEIALQKLWDDELKLPVDIAAGDWDLHFFSDSLLLFASKRPGGYGGYDLYWTHKRNGVWSTPENLGPRINSAYDERSPFLATDGRTLYFSSDHPRRSVGGMDIFRVVYNEYIKEWMQIENMGLLINSAADELYFRLTKDANRAFFTSSRKDGEGGWDLYGAYFQLPQREMLHVSKPTAFNECLYPLNPPETVSEPLSATERPTQFSLQRQADGSALIPLNHSTLEQILALLNENKNFQALFVVPFWKTSEPGKQSLDEVARYFTKQGIAAERIKLQLVHQQLYPLAQSENDKIQVFLEPLSPPLEPNPAKPQPVAHHQSWKELGQGLTYRVQVIAEHDSFTAARLQQFPYLVVECSSFGTPYYYTIGLYRTRTSAEQLQQELQRHNFTNTKVLAYWNNRRLGEEIEEKQ